MRLPKSCALPQILTAVMVAFSGLNVQAMPLGAAASNGLVLMNSEAPSVLEQVQYRRDRGRWNQGPGRYQGRGSHGDDTGAMIGAGILGLIIGGMIASEAQRQQQQSSAYCVQRFRSYDPQSMTYLGYDGLRHPCP